MLYGHITCRSSEFCTLELGTMHNLTMPMKISNDICRTSDGHIVTHIEI